MIITTQYFYMFILGLILTIITWSLDTKPLQTKSAVRKVRNLLALLILADIIWLCMQNFMGTLTFIVFGTGIIALVDILFFQRRRKLENRKQPLIVEYSRSFFSVLLIVWVIRSFIIQPYRVPTGSLEPTVMPGDFLAVNQFAYGLKFPVFNNTLVKIGEPKRGDIALFYWPPDPAIIFVKRVVGVPGDHVVYKNKILYVNGKEAVQSEIGMGDDVEPQTNQYIANEIKTEDLSGVVHQILVRQTGGIIGDVDVTVPKGMYFMMGDNRDDSEDSRMWGFVPERNLIGKAFLIWMNWDAMNHHITWNRIGKIL